MSLRAADILRLPLWTAALATGAKSFRDNKVLGSATLNRLGLHEERTRLAHAIAWSRRERLAHLVDPDDRAAFARDGFVVKRDYLDAALFERLRHDALGRTAPAREMTQGDTTTRRIALDRRAFAALPAVRELVRAPTWSGLLRYVGSYDQEPLYYIQTILSHAKVSKKRDPQTKLHADAFHPTVKAWFFLTDVLEDEGPFVYVPGSHRMTSERLAWERERSIVARDADFYSARGSFRLLSGDLDRMKLPAARTFAVPANTLVVADTAGFHARGRSARPSLRAEIFGYGRRSPFLPWTGLDVASLPGIADARIPLLWAALDALERAGGPLAAWRDVGPKAPLTRP